MPNKLVLLVLVLAGVTFMLVVVGLAYVAHRHPSTATPLLVAGAGATVMIAAVTVIATLE
ncbi:hypothetical protein [Streptomyces sp. NPDC001889]